jgi:hypothetical protein
MKISTSTVEKITITDLKSYVGVIHVFVEDYGPERGKVTIEADGNAWSYFWGRTGCSSVKEFFLVADTSYLVGKLEIGIRKTIDDDDSEAIQAAAKKYILKLRKYGDINKSEARDLWHSAEQLDSVYDKDFRIIFGESWWDDIPQKPNPKYKHLCYIVDTVKEALKKV